MSFEHIVVERKGPVAVVTLNRPERMNALTIAVMADLSRALTEFDADNEIGAFVLTGAPRADGQPCFCAGADVKNMATEGSVALYNQFPNARAAYLRTFQAFAKGTDTGIDRGPISVFDVLANFSKPTIAAIDGVCTAGGIELALACDIRIVAETAAISDLHMKNIGHLGGAGLETRLVQLVGPSKTKELLWTGTVINGHEAWRIGLANQVFPSEVMLERAVALGAEISSRRRDAVVLSKAIIDARMVFGERDALRYSDLGAATLNLLADPGVTEEGYRAFAEGRRPSFEQQSSEPDPPQSQTDSTSW